jgi:hypothetical protein
VVVIKTTSWPENNRARSVYRLQYWGAIFNNINNLCCKYRWMLKSCAKKAFYVIRYAEHV